MAKLTLKQIKDYHDTAFTNNQTTRIAAADDLLFSRVTQWDSSLLENSQLGYKGQFDILRKATREIMSDLRTNQVQIEYEPTADSREAGDDVSDLMNGLYLSVDHENTSIEAFDNATQETVDCGIGGWELYAAYETNRAGDRKQRLHRRPLYEFNNTCFPDPNAKLLDKSDATFWSCLEPFSKDGYKAIYKKLTGKETDCAPENFASPECSYVFPWVTGNEIYYLVRFYHRQEVSEKIYTYTDPFGQVVKYSETQLTGRGEDGDIDLTDDLKAKGYKKIFEKTITRHEVKLYIASGEDILKVYRIPGEYIPIIPEYGERAFVEGEEHYEGITRLAKDPQRLRNFVFSFLGDIASRSPREKPIFLAAQLAGLTNMYDINGAENNYPYVLQNQKDADGNELPLGPVGTLPAPQIPVALTELMGLTRQAVEDVANPGLPKDIMDSDLSGEAIEKLQNRIDNQSQVFQDHKKHAKRHDALVFASMASETYDSPRKLTLTQPDGSRKVVEIMQTVIDRKTGEPAVLNDLTGMQFEVYAQIGPSYNSKRQKIFETLGAMAKDVAAVDPNMAKMLQLKQLTFLDGGIDLNDIKEYANKQLMLAGVKEPETDEDKAFMAEQQSQPKQPDAAQIEAQAKTIDAQSKVMKEQRIAAHEQVTAQIDHIRLMLEQYEAQTARIKAEADISQGHAETRANVRLLHAKTAGQHVDNIQKMTQPYRARANV